MHLLYTWGGNGMLIFTLHYVVLTAAQEFYCIFALLKQILIKKLLKQFFWGNINNCKKNQNYAEKAEIQHACLLQMCISNELLL